MKDFLLDDNGDLKIVNGHFVIGDCSAQNQKSLLLATEGEIRSSPLSGVGIFNFLQDEDLDGLQLKARRQFEMDGARFKKLVFEGDGKMKLDASYK